jgi:hypothetical protein
MRGPDGGYVLFVAESIFRLLDLPGATGKLTRHIESNPHHFQ